jgi:tetratricopeptide (TPR) repeat protein
MPLNLSTFKRMNNIYATGVSFGAVGDSYSNLGEYSTALKYYKKYLRSVSGKIFLNYTAMYSGMVPIFLGMQQYDSAVFYAKKGYALFKTSSFYASNDWNTWRS